MQTKWIWKGENFKLKFGKANNIWMAVEIDPKVTDVTLLHDGVYLTENTTTGKFEIATGGKAPAYPMLEPKFQYDAVSSNMVTVSVGPVQAYSKNFAGTPTDGVYLKVDAGKLVPLDAGAGDTVEKNAVARCLAVYSDYIEIQKLY